MLHQQRDRSERDGDQPRREELVQRRRRRGGGISGDAVRRSRDADAAVEAEHDAAFTGLGHDQVRADVTASSDTLRALIVSSYTRSLA